MSASLFGACLLACATLGAAPQDPGTGGGGTPPMRATPEEARVALDRALDWLVTHQGSDGSWGHAVLEGHMEYGYSVESFYDWKLAANALACMALMQCEETPERRGALLAGMDWLCSTELPKRGNHWDSDFLWAGLYGLVATVEAADDPRFAADGVRERVAARGRAFLSILVRNQSPEGGWAYYDDPPWSRRPNWATSFCTALVLPALERCEGLGWLDDTAVRRRAERYVRLCAMPGGAYSYDLTPLPRISGGEHINRTKGSLGRIQVCNWGLGANGESWVTSDKVRRGLEDFFEHHRFLDVARMRPIPHEAYYANAGYFYFFGHYYAARVIELLPEGEREDWHARLRPHLIKTQRADGSTSDFLATSYMITASTSYLALALAAGLPPRGEE